MQCRTITCALSFFVSFYSLSPIKKSLWGIEVIHMWFVTHFISIYYKMCVLFTYRSVVMSLTHKANEWYQKRNVLKRQIYSISLIRRAREKKPFQGNEQEHCFNCHLMSKASPRTEAFDIMSKTKRGSVCVCYFTRSSKRTSILWWYTTIYGVTAKREL